MKILSNFDTRLGKKLRKEYEESFGEWNVLLVHKSKFFFYKHIWLSFFLYIILLIVWAYFLYSYEPINEYLERWFWWVFILYWLLLFIKNSRQWINYRMDFLLVTPKEVIKYDQKWVFWRSVDKIHSEKVKAIRVSKHWFLMSLLNIWTLKFLAEWDRDEGDILMEYVDWVEAREKRIRTILSLDTLE